MAPQPETSPILAYLKSRKFLHHLLKGHHYGQTSPENRLLGLSNTLNLIGLSILSWEVVRAAQPEMSAFSKSCIVGFENGFFLFILDK